MKSDLFIQKVIGVEVVAIKGNDDDLWDIVIINRNDYSIDNVLITSKGYGKINGERQITSTLRHMIEKLDSHSYAKIEPIQNKVLHLTSEYWISYYVNKEIYDKKYIFLPDCIQEKNISKIPGFNLKGVIHK